MLSGSPASPAQEKTPFRAHSPRTLEKWSGQLPNLHPISRVLSASSMNGTPRSSDDFYSMSNHSSETKMSEYMPPDVDGRLLPKSSHSRQLSQVRRSNHDREPETLMMGYAQTMGHFTLDGSLVNQAPFEEVKRKGVVGGQGGGGVVGVDHSKRESGLFGALGWGNIGASLGGLLGGNEMSSIKEMRGIASSKMIPLLTTPQSILFVDLRLFPGESKSYNYTFRLPRGLPPSHKGRAIKVTYHLNIGLQRSGTVGSQQAVKHVEVPFRVLGSVNGRGEILGHDLMSPYILLNDNARTSSITPSSPLPTNMGVASKLRDVKPDAASLADFLSYTDALLAHPHADPNAPLVSPTATRPPPLPRQSSTYQETQFESMREAIDYAIMRANVRTPPAGPEFTLAEHQIQAANRFNIARSGIPIAVLTLLRPAFRLGESIIGTLDFSAAAVPTYAIKVELESAEQIDPALALRSAGSVQRVTRRVHAEMRESALFAQRLSFNLTIPTTATPTFETTGVSLQWMVRVEFTTARMLPGGVREEGEDELLEELGRDERALTMIAKERLLAEAFEVGIPIKVYGVVTGEMDGKESEGLVV
ncbi:hypothetical protein LTR28_001298 [Elasticomyces elasticus]|nr:hypothetical protein LTR28_001298 [Elasticomyces elasticus]